MLPGEKVDVCFRLPADPLLQLFRGTIVRLCVDSDGRMRAAGPMPPVLVPGAFNPAHAGHRRLAEVATRLTGLPAAFELSVHNVDKPPLSLEEIRRRIDQFTWQGPLWLTRAPTFLEKAKLFPGTVFAIGLDTAERIVAPRYYESSESAMRQALEEIRAAGCRFLVAGRSEGDRFRTLDQLSMPAGFRDLFQAVAESDFRLDLSSTKLREQAG